MKLFILFSILITLASFFSYVNVKTFKLPSGISLMLMGTFVSFITIGIGIASPSFSESIRSELIIINFSDFVLGIILCFLLFAGSLHVRLDDLRKQAKVILSFSTAGTVISTFIVGYTLFYLLPVLGFETPLLYCLLFGALISPTDPIAVMGILKKANLQKSIETKITGESLFNDGIGVVVFITLINISVIGIENTSASSILLLFLQEAIGGIVVGLLIGYIGFKMMKTIDHFQTEILLSLAMVMGGYSLCHFLHVSGPLAMVIAGLTTGNIGKRVAMSDITRDYLEKFWEVTDEVLNAILFLLIGLEIVVVNFQFQYLITGIIMSILLIIIRYISLWIPVKLFFLKKNIETNALKIMTWGGLRGGISIALALSLPTNEYKNTLVSITFIVVLFSILVQGFTIEKVIKKFAK